MGEFRRATKRSAIATGLHPHYHRPTDDASGIIYRKLARVASLMHQAAVALGNRRARPR